MFDLFILCMRVKSECPRVCRLHSSVLAPGVSKGHMYMDPCMHPVCAASSDAIHSELAGLHAHGWFEFIVCCKD